MTAVITLTTDFGLADAYVAAMKGVILGINLDARLVDISHTIKPQSIAQAAFVLRTAYKFFPRRTIHLIVVDPGVGIERKAVILRTPEVDFVAPDNGVLSYIIDEYAGGNAVAGRQPLDTARAQAIEITNRRYWLSDVSATFHGRDIFAPLAAHLSLGTPLAEFGDAIPSLAVLPALKPRLEPDGTLTGCVLHIDNFGNLITNIRKPDLPPDTTGITVEVKSRLINGLAKTYAESDGLCALIGSGGHLEVALKNGNAAAYINAEVDDQVKIRSNEE